MEITALGMIETIGLVSAIEAADAGLKASHVRLLGTDYVRGGLVMVRFEGEVAAVQAAVDAGAAAAQRLGNVFSAHVIARAMPEVFCMLASDPGIGPAKRSNSGCVACGGCEGGRRDLEKAARSRAGLSSGAPVTMQELKGWKVVSLRQYVRKLKRFPLTPNEIRYANKARLLEVLESYLKGSSAT